MRGVKSARVAAVGVLAAWLQLAASAPMARAQADAPKAGDDSRAKAKAAPAPRGAKPAAKAKPGDEAPIVMSSEALARARGKPLDRDRYDGEPDWDRLPPWRQASFFGIRAQGQLFLYVVDCSGSMDDQDRLARAKSELRRSVGALQSPQRFKVIFYNDRPVPMPGDLPKPADSPSKAQLARWLPLVQAEGPTDPRVSLSLALAFRPDAVFLLSDGAFPDGTAESIARLNPGKVPIHCVDLANGEAGAGLRKIAADSGGQYVARGR